MRVSYLGHEALTFPDYIDWETGRTLHATPGGVYDITPASGRAVPDYPEQWFTPVPVKPVKPPVPAKAVPESAAGED